MKRKPRTRELLREINDTVGPRVGGAIESVAQYTQQSGNGVVATVVGLVVLFFAATTVFAQLQDSLNIIWGVRPKHGGSWWDTVKDRFLSFAVVLGIGFLLLVSLLLSALLSSLTHLVTPSSIPGGAYIWRIINWLVSFGLITVLFAMIYKLLPDVEIEWQDVWVGAAVTSILFAVGKYLIGLYLGRSTWINAYGAAGSLVVVLLWVYYSSQIFLFGAEFTYVYANESGKPLRPKANAELVTEEARARQGLSRREERRGNSESAHTRSPGLGLSIRGWPMLHRLQARWDEIRESYWFLPAILTALAVGLALLTVHIDQVTTHDWLSDFALVYTRGPDGARAVLATVAGSMITVAGVVFSVTIVALSLASNQFGPRLLRNFMRDRGNQVVLGTFVATFVYCLLVLRTVRGTDGNEFVPHLSVTVAIVLALASLGVLIYFIHHVAMSIQAPEIVANVANDMHEAIDRFFPEELGEENGDERPQREADVLPEDFDRDCGPVSARNSGYVQAIDGDLLIALAGENDLLIRLRRRPGQFVIEGSLLAEAWPSDRLSDDLMAAIRDTYLIGSRQTPAQDAAFAINQLVEVAVRALSPGVNDPFTALNCLDRLGESLCHVAQQDARTSAPRPRRKGSSHCPCVFVFRNGRPCAAANSRLWPNQRRGSRSHARSDRGGL